ncbi:MAG: DUF4203 domain-containing protein [Spirochaetales bacterium]
MLEALFAEASQYVTELGWPGLTIALAGGIIVAVAGYRIRMVFFFVVGFYAGAAILGPFFAGIINEPQTAIVFSLIIGTIGGFIAVRLYFVALFLAGVLAGASLLITVSANVLPDTEVALLAVAGIGAVVGGIAALVLDRIAVIAASAWVGALHAAASASTIIDRTAGVSEGVRFGIFLTVLVIVTAIGILYQLRAFPTRRYRYAPRR